MEIILITLGVVLILMMIVFTARTRIYKRYNKYLKVENSAGINGIELANLIAKKHNMPYITIALTNKELGDAYVPKHKTVIMSEKLAYSSSITTLAVVSHEFGHAIQDKRNESLFGVTNALASLTRLTNKLVGLLIASGIIGSLLVILTLIPLHLTNLFLTLFFVGISFIALNLLVKLLSIPIEYGASRKALRFLNEYKLISRQEARKVKKLLNTAALTYIASLFDGIFIFRRKMFKLFSKKTTKR